MPLYQPIDAARIAYGSYGGDNTANKAIAHGLPVTPRIVLIYTDSGNKWFFRITWGLDKIAHSGDHTTAPAAYAVTQMTSTYFYVGDGVNHIATANNNTYTYYWVAIG